MVNTLAASFDGELFDLLISAAMGRKGAVVEMDIPERFDPNKVDIYLKFTDLVSELEKQKITQYYLGVTRREILVVVDPNIY